MWPRWCGTFVWQIMLNPELGIVNAIGTDVLGWRSDRVPGAAVGHHQHLRPRPGRAGGLTVVILYQAWRYFPFSFLFILAGSQALPGELDEAARVDGATPAAVLAHHPASAPGRHRPADGAAGSSGPSTSSTTSTCSPRAAPAPRWSRCGCSTTSPAAATSAPPRPLAGAGPAPGRAAVPLLPLLRQPRGERRRYEQDRDRHRRRRAAQAPKAAARRPSPARRSAGDRRDPHPRGAEMDHDRLLPDRHPVPLLLHGHAVHPHDRGPRPRPGGPVAAPGRDRWPPSARCCSVEDGGRGFLPSCATAP